MHVTACCWSVAPIPPRGEIKHDRTHEIFQTPFPCGALLLLVHGEDGQLAVVAEVNEHVLVEGALVRGGAEERLVGLAVAHLDVLAVHQEAVQAPARLGGVEVSDGDLNYYHYPVNNLINSNSSNHDEKP